MKKLIFTFVAICLFGGVFVARGQYAVRGERNSVIVDGHGNRVVDIYSRPGNDLSIRVAGIEVTLGNNRYRPKFVFEEDSDHWGTIELGASLLSDVTYKNPSESFLDLKTGKSTRVAINFASMSLKSRRSPFGFSTGIALVYDNYTFANDVKLVNNSGNVTFAPIESNKKKSKLTTASLRVPIFLDINLTRQMFVSAGVYGEVVMRSFTKVKFPKDKSNFSPVTPLRAGATVRMGFANNLYVFGDYGFSELFNTNNAPSAHPIAVGIGFGF